MELDRVHKDKIKNTVGFGVGPNDHLPLAGWIESL